LFSAALKCIISKGKPVLSAFVVVGRLRRCLFPEFIAVGVFWAVVFCPSLSSSKNNPRYQRKKVCADFYNAQIGCFKSFYIPTLSLTKAFPL